MILINVSPAALITTADVSTLTIHRAALCLHGWKLCMTGLSYKITHLSQKQCFSHLLCLHNILNESTQTNWFGCSCWCVKNQCFQKHCEERNQLLLKHWALPSSNRCMRCITSQTLFTTLRTCYFYMTETKNGGGDPGLPDLREPWRCWIGSSSYDAGWLLSVIR